MKPDVIIVGSGQAGVPLAARLAAAGKQVLIVERGELGGTCVNSGCTPTKTMIASARAAHVARGAGRLGVHAGEVKVDFPAVVARKDGIVKRWREGVERRLAGERIELVRGHARLVGGRQIEVDGRRWQAETLVLNVGARPAVPELHGLDHVPFLDNKKIMELQELPRHLIVLGGGYIGCEFAQMFRRFGAKVTVVHRNDHLLSREDPDTSIALEEVFHAEGIALRMSARAESVVTADGEVVLLLGGGEVRGSHLLVAVGRRANTDDLGCAAAGVALDGRGFIQVDDGYATSAPGIFAVGDCSGGPQFTHTAWDDHRLLFDRLMGRGQRGRRDRVIPFAVFTDPQIAGVGLSEREARAAGIAYEVATMPFGHVARAVELDEPAGTMKVLVAGEKLLGCRLVGSEVGELIHIFAVLMQAGAGLRAVVDSEFVHPTFAEGVQSLVMKLPRFALA